MPMAIDAMKASLTLRPRSLDADLMPGERQLERREAVGGAAADHHRGHRSVGDGRHPADRRDGVPGLLPRGPGLGHGALGEVERAAHGRDGQVGAAAQGVGQVRVRDVADADVLRLGRRRGVRLVRVGLRPELEQAQAHHHRGLAVGDGVVQLEQEGRLAARQALDERRLPQGAVVVEVRQAHAPGVVEQLAPAGTVRQPVPPQVHVHVEVGVDGEAGGREPQGAEQRAHAQGRDEQGEPIDPLSQARPVGGRLEDRQGHDRRPHRGVAAGRAEGGRVPAPQLRADEVVHD